VIRQRHLNNQLRGIGVWGLYMYVHVSVLSIHMLHHKPSSSSTEYILRRLKEIKRSGVKVFYFTITVYDVIIKQKTYLRQIRYDMIVSKKEGSGKV